MCELFTLINLIQVHACTLSLKLSQLCTQKGTFSNIVRGIGGGGGEINREEFNQFYNEDHTVQNYNHPTGRGMGIYFTGLC